MKQAALFETSPAPLTPLECVTSDPGVDALIDAGAPVLVCVSGGKDSRLAARAVRDYCTARGHQGPFRLIYADLNTAGLVVTWHDAKNQCHQLAHELGTDLVVVARPTGGLLERWRDRYRRGMERYCALELVKTLLPWSTPKMRFCTSELKTRPIQTWISKTYGTQPVVCVIGIRRDESSNRSSAPVATSYSTREDGSKPALPAGSIDWNAIVHVRTPDVYEVIAAAGDTIPEAYTVYGASRYSCCACIMSSQPDLLAARRDPRNHPVLIEQCRLEIESTFAFQGSHWLSDTMFSILPHDLRAQLPEAKKRKTERERFEQRMPDHLLFENDGSRGWPKTMPTPAEAELVAEIRRQVGELMGWPVQFTTGHDVLARYAELLEMKAKRDASKGKRSRARSPQTGMVPFCGEQSPLFQV